MISRKAFLFSTHTHTTHRTHTQADIVCYAGRCELQKHCPLRFTPLACKATSSSNARGASFPLRGFYSNPERCFFCLHQTEKKGERKEGGVCLFACGLFQCGMNVGCEGKAARVLCRGLGYVSLWFTSLTPAAVQPEFIKLHASRLYSLSLLSLFALKKNCCLIILFLLNSI